MKNTLKKFDSEQKTVAKNYSALMILQGLNYVLPFLIIPFLVQTLELERFGLVMLAQYVMALCVAATDFGFSTTAVREISLLKAGNQDYSSVYFKVFWVRVVLLFAVFLLLCAFVFAIPRFAVEWEVYLLSYGMVVGQTLLADWFFQGIERMRILTMVNAISKILFTLLLFIFISSPSDYLFVPIFNSVGYLFAGLVMLGLSMRYVTWQWPNFKGSRDFYKDSFQVFISDLSGQFTYAANGVLLGMFAGDSIVGIFSAFDKLMLAARKMYLPVCQAVYPYLSRKTFADKRKMMRQLFFITLIIGIFSLLFIVFLGSWIVDLLFDNPEIAANVNLLQWMGLTVVFVGLSLLFTNLYAPARKLFGLRLRVMVFATIFNLILGLILVPFLGLKGTVATTILTEFFLVVLSAIFYSNDKESVPTPNVIR
jgi:PST family polysaccharide transporter